MNNELTELREQVCRGGPVQTRTRGSNYEIVVDVAGTVVVVGESWWRRKVKVPLIGEPTGPVRVPVYKPKPWVFAYVPVPPMTRSGALKL